MTTAQVTQLAIALGICFAAYKFLHNPMMKAAALGVFAMERSGDDGERGRSDAALSHRAAASGDDGTGRLVRR